MSKGNEAVGELFRLRRAEMNLSLKEIENATSIRMTYLQAIEDGHVGQVISAVYAKGFIKQYSSFLDLDGEQILRENPEFCSSPEKQEFAYGIGTLEVRSGSGTASTGKRTPVLLWGAVGVGVLVAAWYLTRYLGLL
jgi:cytoskeletal protein RodZ